MIKRKGMIQVDQGDLPVCPPEMETLENVVHSRILQLFFTKLLIRHYDGGAFTFSFYWLYC